MIQMPTNNIYILLLLLFSCSCDQIIIKKIYIKTYNEAPSVVALNQCTAKKEFLKDIKKGNMCIKRIDFGTDFTDGYYEKSHSQTTKESVRHS